MLLGSPPDMVHGAMLSGPAPIIENTHTNTHCIIHHFPVKIKYFLKKLCFIFLIMFNMMKNHILLEARGKSLTLVSFSFFAPY